MKRPLTLLALVLAPLALGSLGLMPPASAQDVAVPDDVYPHLVSCYVYYEQDKAQAAARGDRAREARRGQQIQVVIQLLAPASQSAGKSKAQVEADLRAGMDGYFNALASGQIQPEDLPKQVEACEAWIEPQLSPAPAPAP